MAANQFASRRAFVKFHTEAIFFCCIADVTEDYGSTVFCTDVLHRFGDVSGTRRPTATPERQERILRTRAQLSWRTQRGDDG